MATYTLTTGNDAPGSTTGADTYDGAVGGATGGIDALSGGAGDDLFLIGTGSAGTITGDADADTVRTYGIDLGTTTFATVEVLDFFNSSYLTAGIDQLASFTSIIRTTAPDSQLTFYLTGPGGTIDFSSRVTGGYSVYLQNSSVTAGFTATGTGNADVLGGSGYSDTLNGGSGADALNGAAGNDTLNGGAGDDTIYTGYGGDTVNGGDDGDTIYLQGDAAATVNGDAGNDFIHIYGGLSGTISGGAGTDTLVADFINVSSFTVTAMEVLDMTYDSVTATVAQLGSFSSIINSFNPDTQLIFNLTGAGGTFDFSTRLSAGYSVSVSDQGLTSGVTLTGTANADLLVGSSYGDTLNGGAGADTIFTGQASTGTETVNGGDDSDIIHVETTATATINGDAGDDFIHVGASQTGTIAGGAGTDTLYADGSDLGSFTFSTMEVLDAYYGSVSATAAQFSSFSSIINSDNPNSQLTFYLTGAGGTINFSTRMTGGYSVNVQDGGVTAGYTVTGSGNADTLVGSIYADTLNGGGGADEIHTGYTLYGTDTMNGGAGGDALYVDTYSYATATINGDAGNDVIYLSSGGQLGTINGGADTDTLVAGAGSVGAFTFIAMEVLELSYGYAFATASQLGNFSSIVSSNFPDSQLTFYLTGAGGTINFSTRVTGGYSVKVLDQGVTAGYTVTGSANDDTLNGSGYADKLNGGGGADALKGGQGNDIYYVDNSGDSVIESSAAADGTDTVYAGVNWTMVAGQGIESLRANAGNTGLTLSGNELAQGITGGGGADTLNGNGGNDTLNGQGGADDMTGGADNDIYYVDDAGDQVTENSAASGGNDTVYASASWAMAVGQGIESLRANAGNAGLTLTGNELAHTILGGNGADTLNGNGGNDTLNGQGNADTMDGGAGNDYLYVDSAADIVIEATGGGADTVVASVTYAFSGTAEVEFLKTNDPTATKLISLTGNDGTGSLSGLGGNDTLLGGVGSSLLYGGLGNDKLTGGLGNDAFVFNTALSAATNLDHLTDFHNVSGDNDYIRLDHNFFAGLPTGFLTTEYFAANATGSATPSITHAQIVYNTTTGALVFDSNGGTSGGTTQFAVIDSFSSLTGATALKAGDFLVF